MRARRLLGLVLIATLAGCSVPPSFPPPPGGLKRIAVEKPVNKSNDDLVVYGPGLLQRLLKLDTASVPDVLAEDYRITLTRQGFRLAEPSEGVPVLKTEIFRWQPYSANYETVTVDLGTALASQTFRIRFRIGTDSGTSADGWGIDDVRFTGIVGTPFPAQVPDDGDCTPDDEEPELDPIISGGGGGCCHAGAPGGSGLFALGVLASLVRRRRRA